MALSNEEWDEIVRALPSADDGDAVCAAAGRLRRSATLDDVPGLPESPIFARS